MSKRRVFTGSVWRGRGLPDVVPPSGISHDWTDANPPWAHSSDPAIAQSQFTALWPAGLTVVDIPTASGDFWTNVKSACDAASTPIILRLGAGVYELNQFRLAGTSGSPTFAFGLYHPRLRGFLGQGPLLTRIRMAANSMSGAQLAALSEMTAASFAPNPMGVMLLQPVLTDNTRVEDVYLAGLAVQAADQNPLTTVAADLVAKGVVTPQPAPHQGVVFSQERNATVSYVRFQGAGRALYPAPPFEHANWTSQYGLGRFNNVESDGRRAYEVDPAQPRRCAPVMGNNEDSHHLIDCWLHHANVSRYAMNDQNRETSGPYALTRCKVEQIGNHNIDPNLNGGVSLGGYSQAVCCGYESINGTITFTDPIISVDNPYTDGSISQHIGLSSVGTRNPVGGKLYVHGGRFYNTAFPWLNGTGTGDGWLCLRIYTATYWHISGYANTLFVYDADGIRKTPWVYTGAWNSTAFAAAAAAAGVSPATHFLIRNSNT